MTPEREIADMFMRSKGYINAQPQDVQKIDGQPCWYFLYKLYDGTLELEVSWDGQEWNTLVTTFSVAG